MPWLNLANLSALGADDNRPRVATSGLRAPRCASVRLARRLCEVRRSNYRLREYIRLGGLTAFQVKRQMPIKR